MNLLAQSWSISFVAMARIQIISAITLKIMSVIDSVIGVLM
jgi:hypothetical protein